VVGFISCWFVSHKDMKVDFALKLRPPTLLQWEDASPTMTTGTI
jgi:hypothetical protein